MSQTREVPQESSTPGEPIQKKHGYGAPRWVAAIGVIAVGVLFAALPGNVTIGPSWLLLAILAILIVVPFAIARIRQRPLPYKTARILAFIMLGLVTIALISGVVLLIVTLPSKAQTQAVSLLRTGALLWVGNILVFALWYWEIDGGGPRARHLAGHEAADFMFPQQASGNTTGWAPHFLDYIFVAFTGATALSPTDTYPLTRKAKALMMIEALIALVVLAILIGRSINIL